MATIPTPGDGSKALAAHCPDPECQPDCRGLCTDVRKISDPDRGNQAWSTLAGQGASPLLLSKKFRHFRECSDLPPEGEESPDPFDLQDPCHLTKVVEFTHGHDAPKRVWPKCPPRLRCPRARKLGRTRCKSWQCQVCGPVRAHDDLSWQAAALAAWADWTPPSPPAGRHLPPPGLLWEWDRHRWRWDRSSYPVALPGRPPVPGRLVAYRLTPINPNPAELRAAVIRLQESTRSVLRSVSVLEPPLHLHVVAAVRDLDPAELRDLLAHTFGLRPVDLADGRLWATTLPGPGYAHQSPLEAAQHLLRYQLKNYLDPATLPGHLQLNHDKPSHLHPDLPRVEGMVLPGCPSCGRG